jgi:hypothetical protein
MVCGPPAGVFTEITAALGPVSVFGLRVSLCIHITF